ncbi:hypothetical protein Tco_0464087 [Tanacetum coccineum]
MVKYLKNQGNYKISDFKGMSYNEIRPIFKKVWDFNQQIEPMDEEHGSEKMKSPEKIEEEDVDTQKEVSKESGAKRKKSIPRKSTRKRQKMEEDAEKEDLKGYLDIIPREVVPIERMAVPRIIRFLSEDAEDFDRQDVEELVQISSKRVLYWPLVIVNTALKMSLYCGFELRSITAANGFGNFYGSCLNEKYITTAGLYLMLLTVNISTARQREMITSQLQGKLWLYDEVRTRIGILQAGGELWKIWSKISKDEDLLKKIKIT